MRILSIRLPRELDHQLHKEAHQRQMTRSELARQVIAEYLKRLAEVQGEPPAPVPPGQPEEIAVSADEVETPAPAAKATARGRKPKTRTQDEGH
jgi:hypothetical protein